MISSKGTLFVENPHLHKSNFATVLLKNHLILHGGTYKLFGKGKITINSM